ncbi:TPA: hypothetical protein DD449_00650 [Candidatus Berkelbacteria bacterium]|uniref:Uncharacterized protein n=1 Tax=Berkelbacteria bacterium GW2011_GWE1_39_12 TaxID=1618337 RepID=A0A0G4B5B0_9BACT|nr:MAG: hypothetical protein UT28_C0001G0958 [Berkelbacteria bacterium GW2011_GWE1_39_12]HBO60180.1 hypothetical protein [Candidatus Berkelbacteria bacterium]
MTKKIILIVGTIIVLFFSAFVLLKIQQNKINQAENTNNSSQNTSLVKATESTKLNGKIYYISYKEGSLEINSYNTSDDKITTVYSDKDEEYKIGKFGNFTNLSSEFLATIKNSNKEKLVSFKFNDKADMHVLREDFSISESFAADPLGKEIYYSKEFITDSETKHNLYQETRDGKNQRLLYQANAPILDLSISIDGQKAFFTQDDNRIIGLDLNTFEDEQIYKTGDKIFDLSVLSNGNLIFTEANEKNINSSIVYLINLKTGELKKDLSLREKMLSSAIISPDMIATGVVQKNFEDNFNDMQTGELSTIRIGSDKINTIGSGIHIICWKP